MKCLNILALLLIIVGALNWGLWGFFEFDLVAYLLGGNTTWLSRLVYGIVGLAGVWSLGFLGKCKALCCSDRSDNRSDKGPGGSGGGCCKM